VIDLHAHVLPMLDDGPDSMSESLELLTAAEYDGIEILVATPHIHSAYPAVLPGQLARRTAELQEEVRHASIPLRLVSGAEVDLDWAGQASDDDLRACTFGARGGDLLVETPYRPLGEDFEEALFSLSLRGFRIVLAHPERNVSFQETPSRLAALAARGTLLQVTALALTNPSQKSRSRRLARSIVSEGVAHVIASDAHRATGERPAGIAEGVAAAAALTSPARAAWMVTEAPAAILAGEPLPPAPVTRRRFALRRR
jgi:protein-tyrosine phosphatase